MDGHCFSIRRSFNALEQRNKSVKYDGTACLNVIGVLVSGAPCFVSHSWPPCSES